MTENEAIEELKYDCNELGKAIPCDTSWGVAIESAYDMAIKALEEIQQYRAIGTVEECQAAIEKQKPQLPDIWGDGCDKEGNIIYDMYDCPGCGQSYEIDDKYKYCPECGQAISWRGFENL